MAPRERPVSASELAEYAYCPRAHWYSTHAEAAGGRPRPDPKAREGVRYHHRALSAERRRDAHVAAYVGLLLLGGALIAFVLVVVGGM